jgi:hypothetical protein
MAVMQRGDEGHTAIGVLPRAGYKTKPLDLDEGLYGSFDVTLSEEEMAKLDTLVNEIIERAHQMLRGGS